MAVTKAFPETPSGFVGPYRLHGHLASGGMGEVYEGYDERLDRPVALKRVRPDAGQPERARRRFSREARALARIVHPAIVQVHDWVATADGDWIVMELVAGRSLRELLAAGPLPPGRAARLARHVLEGLAVAHAAGVVHRDLKAENVMVVEACASGRGGEQAKLLDFGLAKRFEPGTGDTAISVDGTLVGTISAMSPEQVLGRDVGPRSDLFSLGSLLYEMTTGVQPFTGGAVATIAHRICTVKPPPARELSPAVPAPLSAFIDRLMEKDPRRRPASAEQALAELEAVLAELPTAAPAASRPDRPRPRRQTTLLTVAVPRRRLAAALTIAVVLLVVMGLNVMLRQPPEPTYVAVPETRITAAPGAAAEDLELAAGAVRTALLQGLVGFRGLAALEPSGEEAEIEDPAALARALAADEVLASRLDCGAGSACRVVLSRLQGADGRVLRTRGFTVETDRFLELSRAALGHLGGVYPDFRLRRDAPDLEVRGDDYEAYLRLWRRFESREEGHSTGEILDALETLQRTSPRFVTLPLFEALVLVRRFGEERNPADLERARRAVERARSLAPEDPRVLVRQVQLARVAGRLDEAETALETLRRLEPGSERQMMEQARVLEERGATEEAIALARKGVERRPSASHHFILADMLYRHGDVAAARRHLEAGLERSPNHYDGRSRLAQIELLSGSPERAARLYEELVAHAAGSAELGNLGTAYLLLERYGEAARRFREALELSPTSAYVALNLADAELLLGRRETAEELYLKVLELAAEDPHPEALLTVRAQALAHLGRAGEAVAAVQEALRRQPDHPGVAYEAALVYALLGDQASALWNAQRALELGVEPRWFAFPWFAPLRERIPQEPGN